jgi:hypothetical protein
MCMAQQHARRPGCCLFYAQEHSWAMAPKTVTPASALRHPSFQSSTGPRKCRTASTQSSSGPVSDIAVLVHSSTRPIDAEQNDIPAINMLFDVHK